MVPLEPSAKRKLIWVGAVLAPMLTVQLVRVAAGPGPATASAAAADATATLPGGAAIPAARPLTEAQVKAAEFVAGYRLSATLHSPMDRDDPQPQPSTPSEPVTPTPPAPEADSLAGLTLSAIVGENRGDERAMAMISHRLRRVGDEVAPGWRIRSIDPRRRTVILEGPAGREAVLTPPAGGE